jgi:arabinofuranosyltransferase
MIRLVRQPTTYLVLACILLLAHAFYYASLLDFDAVDDAYISFRYARNAARGDGLTFNVGERRVEGYTNFLWTVMLIPAFWLGLPARIASLLLGILWALGGVLLVWRFSREVGAPPWLGSIAAFLLAADGSYALWAVGGLEAPLFATLVLAGALSYLRELRDERRAPLSGLWFALATMARPEGLLVYALTGVHQVATRLISARRPAGRRLATRQDWQRLALFAALFLPWFAFRWRYYGYPLPNTFYAKVTLGDTAAQRARGLAYVSTFARIHLGYLTVPLVLLPLLRRRWRAWASYLLLVIAGYTAYIAYVGGDWSVGRFFVPLLPLFCLLLSSGLAVLGGWLHTWLRARRAIAAWAPRAIAPLAVLALGGSLFASSSLYGEKALYLDPFDARLAGQARTQMGLWLRDHVPEDTYIAVDAAGQMPFYSDLRALDLYGLNDLTIAHSQVETMGEGTPGHEKMDMNYVLFTAQPDYIIIYGTAFDWLSAYSYERVDLPWTEDPALKGFLGVYRRQ